MADREHDILTLTTEIVASFFSNGAPVQTSEIPEIIRRVRDALMEEPAAAAIEEAEPKATKRQISKSITPDALISFIDGKPYKTLKRHLTRHGHTLESYKTAYGLPFDYPSVAATYSATRSAMAKTRGLGAKVRGKEPPSKAAPAKSRAKGGRVKG